MTGIYKITNISNSVYIGQSWDIERRWIAYKTKNCRNQPAIYKSICKYGIKNHKFEVLHELPSDVEQSVLDNYEQLYIQLFKDCGLKMLNMNTGGTTNSKHSEEVIEKIRQAHLKREWSDEHKMNVRVSIIASNKRRTGTKRSQPKKKILRSEQTGLKCPKARIVLHTETGIFSTLRDAANMIGISEQFLWVQLNYYDGRKNKTKFVYA